MREPLKLTPNLLNEFVEKVLDLDKYMGDVDPKGLDRDERLLFKDAKKKLSRVFESLDGIRVYRS